MPSPPNAGSALPPIEVGTRLTNYGSLDLIVEGSAEGGFALVVWGPNRADNGRMVALKMLRPDLLARANAISAAEGERLRREFEREALTWRHLWPHANIITAHALTRLPGWNNLPVLELDYAPRGSLRQALTEGQSSRTSHLSLRAALAWGQQVAAALAVIHQPDPACERPNPLVHCDVKPENVLFTAHGWAQLTDLGLTRAYAATSIASSTLGGSVGDDSSGPVGDLRIDLTPEDARDERMARMRAALQTAGLLATDAAASAPMDVIPPGNTPRRTVDVEFVTRGVRIPPIPPTFTSTSAASNSSPGIGSRGPVAGTPPYMPPEQWWGLDAVTPASDVYALGVVLFELFAGGRWSPRQQRVLDDQEDAGAQSTAEQFVQFPHAPQFNAEAQAYLEGWGGSEGQQAYFAAWYAAHRAGPRWRLVDPAVGALTRGPLAEIADKRAQDARQALARLSALVEACLAPEAAQRPAAAAVRQRLGEIARLAGQEPLVIPEVYPHTPAHEAAFWENLALTYGNIGQPEERLRLQRRGVALEPEDPSHWMSLGAAYNELLRHEEALAAFAEAQQRLQTAYQAREPGRAALLAGRLANNQAVALADLGRYAEAVSAYQRVLAMRPDAVATRFNLAVALVRWSEEAGAAREQRLERLRAARKELRQALAEAPGYENARRLLADIERALARMGEA